MNVYITLDYELFFGAKSGSVDACMIKPTEALLKIVEPYNIKLTCFVDVGYLVRLEAQKEDYPQLQEDYTKVSKQIKYLAERGHGMELHIHPHWEDSFFNGTDWIFDTKRYKLADFPSEEIIKIVTKYTETLTRIAGRPPKAYRAGGWSAQPFKNIGIALRNNNVLIDSTVFPKGYYNSSAQFYDFKKVEQYNTQYRFLDNLVTEKDKGIFTEIPISSYQVNPLFFWKFAYHKIVKQKKHEAFGDGLAISKTKKDTFRLMTSFSNSVVSIDGYKASFLEKAFQQYIKHTNPEANFVIIGHPKAFTSYSLQKTKKFIEKTKKRHTFRTFQEEV